MRHEDRQPGRTQNFARDTAQQALAQPRPAIGAGNDHVGAQIGGPAQQRRRDVASFRPEGFDRDLGTMTLEMRRHDIVIELAQCFVIRMDEQQGHMRAMGQRGQCIGDRTRRFPCGLSGQSHVPAHLG